MKIILDNLVLGAFFKSAFENARQIGISQYISAFSADFLPAVVSAGNTQFFILDSLKRLKVKINSLEKQKSERENFHFVPVAEMSDSWYLRLLCNPSFSKSSRSFCNLSAFAFEASKEDFAVAVKNISKICAKGSALVFACLEKDEKTNSGYTLREVERLMDENGFLIYEYADRGGLENRFLRQINKNSSDNCVCNKKINAYVAVKQ